jgi:methyl-accepting chemotaxis protein
MPSTNLRLVVTRTLALPVLLLLALAAALSIWIVHLIRTEAWVQHSYDVLSDISETQKLLVDQETGLRAYILTGDAAFLRPYLDGSVRFPPHLEALRRATSDNPRQGKRIEELRQRYGRWFRHAIEDQQLVVAKGQGLVSDAATRARLIARKQQMDEMRADFAVMHDEESSLLHRRLTAAKQANLTLFGAGALLLLVSAILLVGFLRAQLRLIDQIHQAKVEESERARRVAEGLAHEVQESSDAMEQALLTANRERDEAVQALRESRSQP